MRNAIVMLAVVVGFLLGGLDARGMERPDWEEGQVADYGLLVRIDTTVRESKSSMLQQYSLRLEVKEIAENGWKTVRGRVFDVLNSHGTDDGSVEAWTLGARFDSDGEFDLSTDEPVVWHDPVEALLHTEFVIVCDEEGRIVRLSGLDRPLSMLQEIEDGLTLFGVLHPENLAAHLEPLFTLDGGIDADGDTWESSLGTGVGEGRELVREYAWELSRNGSYEATIEATLNSSERTNDLSPRGTLEAYEGRASLSVEEGFVLSRSQTEKMSFVWRVDSLETRSSVESHHALSRIEEEARELPPAHQVEERSTNRALDPGDGD